MPFVKWKKGNVDITPEDEIPVGRNILELTNIINSANYTCIAASTLGQIEASAVVKVQCKLLCLLVYFKATYNIIQILILIFKLLAVWKFN